MNDRQKRFVAHYLKDPNATKAAIAAGYSPNGAAQSAAKLLRIAKIADAISLGRAKLADKLEVSVERVARELARLAFYDPRKFFYADGHAKPITELDDDTAMALAGMDVVELSTDGAVIGHVKKFKLSDKGANCERLGRHLGMFKDRIGIDGSFELVVKHIGVSRDTPPTETK